jgi:biotin transport system substrate-specific component
MNTTTTTALGHRTVGRSALYVAAGALAIVLGAQVAIPLPGTPVPLTLQTLSVVLVGFALGMRRGLAAVAAYLLAGALGAPVFAGFASITSLWGPTSGYLLGFLPAVALSGWATDRGWKHPVARFGVAVIAQGIIIAIGSAVLSTFVGWHQVWAMGIAWFLVGDVVKSALAAGIMMNRSAR